MTRSELPPLWKVVLYPTVFAAVGLLLPAPVQRAWWTMPVGACAYLMFFRWTGYKLMRRRFYLTGWNDGREAMRVAMQEASDWDRGYLDARKMLDLLRAQETEKFIELGLRKRPAPDGSHDNL